METWTIGAVVGVAMFSAMVNVMQHYRFLRVKQALRNSLDMDLETYHTLYQEFKKKEMEKELKQEPVFVTQVPKQEESLQVVRNENWLDPEILCSMYPCVFEGRTEEQFNEYINTDIPRVLKKYEIPDTAHNRFAVWHIGIDHFNALYTKYQNRCVHHMPAPLKEDYAKYRRVLKEKLNE